MCPPAWLGAPAWEQPCGLGGRCNGSGGGCVCADGWSGAGDFVALELQTGNCAVHGEAIRALWAVGLVTFALTMVAGLVVLRRVLLSPKSAPSRRSVPILVVGLLTCVLFIAQASIRISDPLTSTVGNSVATTVLFSSFWATTYMFIAGVVLRVFALVKEARKHLPTAAVAAAAAAAAPPTTTTSFDAATTADEANDNLAAAPRVTVALAGFGVAVSLTPLGMLAQPSSAERNFALGACFWIGNALAAVMLGSGMLRWLLRPIARDVRANVNLLLDGNARGAVPHNEPVLRMLVSLANKLESYAVIIESTSWLVFAVWLLIGTIPYLQRGSAFAVALSSGAGATVLNASFFLLSPVAGRGGASKPALASSSPPGGASPLKLVTTSAPGLTPIAAQQQQQRADSKTDDEGVGARVASRSFGVSNPSRGGWSTLFASGRSLVSSRG